MSLSLFVWNVAAGRLESATVTTDPRGILGTHNYGYDAIGRRAWKEVNDESTGSVVTTKTVYIYSGSNCIAEYNSGTAATQPGNQYIYAGGIDSLAMIIYPDNTPKKLSVVRNQQWSIIGLVDVDAASDHVQEMYAYNVFGERTILDPSNGNIRSTSSFGNPYGYTSRRHDEESGMTYFRARYYDPTTGEFVSPDPLGYVDGMSLYRGYFVPGAMDPSGLGQRSDVVDGSLQYSCNCGWIDWSHVDYSVIDQIWNQIQTENGKRSLTGTGFKVNAQYGQHDPLFGFGPFSRFHPYFVSDDLCVDCKKNTFLGIWMDVSTKKENFQGEFSIDRVRESSWSEEDLASNLLGFYRAIGETNRTEIEDLCRVVGPLHLNLAIFDDLYPNGKMGKNKVWPAPAILHKSKATDCICSEGPYGWPAKYNKRKPFRKGTTWRDWKYQVIIPANPKTLDAQPGVDELTNPPGG